MQHSIAIVKYRKNKFTLIFLFINGGTTYNSHYKIKNTLCKGFYTKVFVFSFSSFPICFHDMVLWFSWFAITCWIIVTIMENNNSGGNNLTKMKGIYTFWPIQLAMSLKNLNMKVITFLQHNDYFMDCFLVFSMLLILFVGW